MNKTKYYVRFGFCNGFYEIKESEYTNNGKGYTYKQAVNCRDQLKGNHNIVWTQIVEIDDWNSFRKLCECEGD